MKKLIFTLLILFGAVTQVSADNKILQLKFGEETNWTSYAWLGIWAYGGSVDGQWYDLTNTGSDGIFEASIPEGADKWILAGGHDSRDWSNKDRQTGDINYSDGLIFNITSNDNDISVDNGITKLIQSPKTMNLQFASEAENWLAQGWYGIWAYKTTGGEWYDLTDENSDGIYEVTIPGSYDVWILACGTGTRNNSWGGKIYQSKNLGYASSDDFIFKINEYKNDIDINDGITKLPIINKCAIVGDFNSWTPAEGAAMTQDPLDPNKYTLTINRFAVTAKEYEYKLTANDKWGVYELPSSGNNTYTFNEAGEFKLIFTADLSTNTLTLEAQKYVSVGATGYSTFSSKHSLDFTGLAIKAYRAEINASKQVVLKQVNKIPNNNGVMLVGEPNAEVIVPFTSESDLNDVTNCFVATDGTADIAASTAGSFNYVFVTSPAGFYNLASALPAANVKVGGAYLHTDTELAADPATSRVGWIFDDEVTGINAVENAGNADAKVVYNLNGQRVMNPAKGLYIVNGKKVIIK